MIYCAVSALIQVENHFLLLKRADSLSLFPGYLSLPGGAIDQGESVIKALTRELQEELSLAIDEKLFSSTPLTTFFSPHFFPRKIENKIFHIQLNQRPLIKLNDENHSYQWISPTEFLAQFQLGLFACVPPLRILFNHLKNFPLSAGPIEIPPDHHPVVEMLSDIHSIILKSPTLPPHTTTNAFVIGTLLIDPSPINGHELAMLYLSLKSFPKIEAIFLTHTHPDHFHLIERWGPELNLPIYLSSPCFNFLKEQLSASLIEKLNFKVIHQVSDFQGFFWKKLPLKTLAVPGHHSGQLALYPCNELGAPKWFLASDLFIPEGSVVLDSSPGSLQQYLKSLQMVITLNPDYLLPSHGPLMGGVEILKKIFNHRLDRHCQIQNLQLSGKSACEILEVVYPELPEKLKFLAKQVIQAHLQDNLSDFSPYPMALKNH